MKAYKQAMATEALTTTKHGPSYEEDFAAWAFYQAMLIRSNRLHLLDRHWIAEELDGLGRGEYRTLRSALMRVLQHMLKWDHQPARRSYSWVKSIHDHRYIVDEQLTENPSLQPRRDEVVMEAYERAVMRAASETKLSVRSFPLYCPYAWDEITHRPFDWPAGEPKDDE